ncbi:MAG: FtsX-like permease family protein, partial [Acidimicrobiia bacterium]|nr:FtsX-like permease family protein [Acidimicrobiia bacterium]
TLSLLLRWSWRDVRVHWVKVAAIALVIAIGTGGYAGLTSTTEWRRVSYDAGYAALGMYDLRVDLASGAAARQGDLIAAVVSIPSADLISGAEERLIFPTQVEVATSARTVVVRGEIVGTDFADGGPHVNGYHPLTGRLLTDADRGTRRVMVDRNFAKFYELAETGMVSVSGDRDLEFVGQATTPEYFMVAPEGEMFMSEATFAGLFATLETAQDLAGMPGRVNNLVLTLAAGADRDTVAAELAAALEALPVGTTILTREDNLSYMALTTDIDQDQAMFDALAFLLIAGAIGAAFNLIHRLAEQQRREIGIGMALGIRPGILATRPLLVGAQIAVLGVLFGVGIGAFIGEAMAAVFEDFIPLPIWLTAFPVPVFARVAAIGLVVPFLAGAIPVWRAVRVDPIEAIKPSYRKERGLHGARLKGNTFAVMPFRSLRRTARRTALTVLGVAAAVMVLMGFLGIMDSVFGAVDTAEREAVGREPARITVALDTFRLADSPEVAMIGAADTVQSAEPALRVAGSVRSEADDIEVFVDLVDLRDGMWSPSITAGEVLPTPGLLLTEKAAADLEAGVGDTVTLRHPRREGLGSYSFVETDLPVVATHPYPVRGFAYMDLAHAELFNLEGIVNAVNVLPVPGATVEEVQQELFALESVASVQSVTTSTEAVRDAFGQVLDIVQVMVVVVLLLALLIAFNTAAINLESRAREHATMFAFGVPVRTALRMAIIENLVIGTLATVIGVAGGLGMVWWMTRRLFAETMPDFALEVTLQPATLAVVVVMGVLAVAIAPVFTLRRMRRMDLPGTLRLVE